MISTIKKISVGCNVMYMGVLLSTKIIIILKILVRQVKNTIYIIIVFNILN